MIEGLFLPGKGSSESCEKGKKGESQIIFRLIQVKSHTCKDLNTRIQRQTVKICELMPFLSDILGTFCGLVEVTKAEDRLTAERRLVSTVGAVWSVVAHFGEVDAHTVAGALPLPAWTSERRRRTLTFITGVSTVVVPVAEPAAQHAVPVVAAEERGGAGARRAGVVFIAAVLAVRVAVALPARRDTAAV